MAKPSDREFALKRQIKDLESQVFKLEEELRIFKKRRTKAIEGEPTKSAKKISDAAVVCPDCGAKLLITEMPHATLNLCTAKCGYRQVKPRRS
jgi:DNA-directed RNA polymerase subunit RPC12/RpoP